MSTPEPPDATPPADDAASTAPADGGADGHPHRNRWPWVCAGLALVAAALLAWGLNRQAELSDSQDQVAALEAENAQAKDTGTTVLTAFKDAYDDLKLKLGAANEDVAEIQDDLDEAQATADQAQKDADAAEQAAADAKNETDKAKAQAEQAKAEAENAESKATIVKDCAKGFVSALGGLFEGTGIDAVKQQLDTVAEDCAGTLGDA